MKNILITTFLLISLNSMAAVKVSQSLKTLMTKQNDMIVKLLLEKTEYTIDLKWAQAKCISTNLAGTEAGTCLVEGQAREEGIKVSVAIQKIRHESGTGDATPEYKVETIDYEL